MNAHPLTGPDTAEPPSTLIPPFASRHRTAIVPGDKKTRMHIGLNLLYASPAIGGAWRYISNVLHMIARYDQQNSYTLFVYWGAKLPLAATAPRMQLQVVHPARRGSRWIRVFHEQTEIPALAKRAGCDLIHSFGNIAVLRPGIRNVVTVHDLKPYARNEGRLPSARDAYVRIFLPVSLRRSDAVLPVSQFTASMIQQRFQIEAGKLITVPNIVDDRFHRSTPAEIAELRRRRQLPSNFWLYVANFYPHKNHRNLLLAYDCYRQRCSRQAWPLVLCGAPTLEYARIRDLVLRLGLEELILFVHGLADSEMPALYSAASALVFPSKYEGFGIPLLEAMACACPIVAADIPAVREFAAGSGTWFCADSLDSISGAMDRLQHDASRRDSLTEAGLKTAEQYRDGVVVQRLMDGYRRGGQA
jgi:glycosyltransferase involved in cell wall biosynthesis